MSAPVLFDLPGPKARARIRIATVIGTVLVAAIVAFVLLKDSSLGFIIGYFELLRQARSLVEFFSRDFGSTYTFQLYVAAALFYIVVNVLLSQLARYAESRTRRSTKTAGTRDAELPADVQMDAGGGAAPPV